VRESPVFHWLLRCCCLLPAQSCLQNKADSGVIRGLVLRISISLFVIALSLAGSIAAASAQSKPPPADVEFSPAPPMPYPGERPPADVGAPLPPPGYGPPPSEPPYGSYDRQPSIYRDANGVPVQSLPDEGSVPRPPVDVGALEAPGEITGAVPSPAPDHAVIAALPPEDQPERGPTKELPPQLRRQLVDYVTSEPAGTIVIDTPHTYLYLVLGKGRALRYGIGVGREGFTWTGNERIRRMTEWPDWHPPKEMIERQPYLPRFMAGGEGNPLGARALYLGNTLYRIHGTNQPSTIGSFVSSGCIRLTNADIEDLYNRVSVGTRVVVLAGSTPTAASAQGQGTVAR